MGIPTLFFTLNVADRKWHDLHRLIPGYPPLTVGEHYHWWVQNIIANRHHSSQYIQHRFTIFLKEVLKKVLHTKDYWCRSTFNYIHCFFLHTMLSLTSLNILFLVWLRNEWQHRRSAHIHGFHWLKNAPNMDTLDWENPLELNVTKAFFDKYVTSWNPWAPHLRNPGMHLSSWNHASLIHNKYSIQII